MDGVSAGESGNSAGLEHLSYQMIWKYGEAERQDGERFYCDMTETKLQRVLARADLFACLDCWVAEDALPSGREQKWLNVVLGTK